MSGPAACRFGVECRRPDCWFAHPNGRSIESQGMPGPGPGPGPVAGPGPMGYGYMPPHQQIPIHGIPPMYNKAPIMQNSVMSSIIKPHQHQPAGSGGEVKKPSKQATPCRFGRACRREGCWFPHPEGRDLDEQPPTTNAHLNGKPGTREVKDALTDDSFDDEDEEDEADFDCPCCHGRPNECETPTCKAAGRCACQFGVANDHVDDTWRDEWFPASRTCTCCEGYVYRCKKQQTGCESGNCHCSLTKNVIQATSNVSLDPASTSSTSASTSTSTSSETASKEASAKE